MCTNSSGGLLRRESLKNNSGLGTEKQSSELEVSKRCFLRKVLVPGPVRERKLDSVCSWKCHVFGSADMPVFEQGLKGS